MSRAAYVLQVLQILNFISSLDNLIMKLLFKHIYKTGRRFHVYLKTSQSVLSDLVDWFYDYTTWKTKDIICCSKFYIIMHVKLPDLLG